MDNCLWSELQNWDGRYDTQRQAQPTLHRVPSLSSPTLPVDLHHDFPPVSSAHNYFDIEQKPLLPEVHVSHSVHDEPFVRQSIPIQEPNLPGNIDEILTSVSPATIIAPQFPFTTLTHNLESSPGSINPEPMFMTSSSPHVEDVERMSDHPSLLGETSSADAEGEDETDELRVDAILRPYYPVSVVASPPPSLYEPSESLSRSSPTDSDFVPPKTSRRLRPRKVPVVLSHVAVPPFPHGLNSRDYKPAHSSSICKANSGMSAHNSIGDALTAAWRHNANISTRYKTVRNAPRGLKRKRSEQEDDKVLGQGTPNQPTITPSPPFHASTLHTPYQSFLQLLLDMVDPLAPPPSSYASLVSATRHLRPEGLVPPLPSTCDQVECRPWMNEWQSFVRFRELTPTTDDEITIGCLIRETFPSDDSSAKRVELDPIHDNDSDLQSLQHKNQWARADTDSSGSTTFLASSSPGEVSHPGSRTHSIKPPSTLATSSNAIRKRKAIEDPEFNPFIQGIPTGSDVNMNMDQYFHELTAEGEVSGPKEMIDQSVSFDPTVESSTFNPADDRLDIDNEPYNVPALNEADLYLIHPDRDDAYDANVPYEDGVVHSWQFNHADSPSNLSLDNRTGHPTDGYIENGTIDPSLLWDSQIHSQGPSLPQLSSPVTTSRKRPFKSSTRASSSHPKKPKYPSSGQIVSSLGIRAGSRRISRPPVRTDMVVTDDLDLSSPQLSDYSSSPEPTTVRSSPSLNEPGLSIGTTDAGSMIEEVALTPTSEITPDPLFGEGLCCHHCRRSNQHEKMLCSLNDCNKRFCRLCIEKRYPDIIFDKHLTTFACPACNNDCVCSVCTRKRGEVYVGERSGAYRRANPRVENVAARRTARRSTTSVSQPPRPKPKVDHNRSPETARPPIAVGSKPIANMNTFWATVYALPGEKIGTGYVGDDGNDQVIAARLVAPLTMLPSRTVDDTTRQLTVPTMPPQPRKRRKKRVFIGTAPEWWNVGPVHELNPFVPSRNIKSRLLYVSSIRTYIGKKPPRRAPVPFDRFSSPLTSVPDSDEAPGDVREDENGVCEVGGVVSLGDEDVQRAIVAALSSLN